MKGELSEEQKQEAIAQFAHYLAMDCYDFGISVGDFNVLAGELADQAMGDVMAELEDDEPEILPPADYDADHAAEWMERHPHGWYNSENDYGTGEEDDVEKKWTDFEDKWEVRREEYKEDFRETGYYETER